MELSERFIQTLEKEGFSSVSEWQEAADTVYTDRSHEDRVSYMVTDGSITFNLGGVEKEISAGQRLNILPGTSYSALVGKQGVIYIMGEM